MAQLICSCLVLIVVLQLVSSENNCGPPSQDVLRFSFKQVRTSDYLEIHCDVGQKILLYCKDDGTWRIENLPGYVQQCSRPRCRREELETHELSRVSPNSMYLNDVVTISCVSGYVGTPIRMRCQKRRCKPGTGCTLFWKPLTRSNGKKLRTVTCKAPEGEVRCPPFKVSPHMKILSSDLEFSHPVYAMYDGLELGCDNGFQLSPVDDEDVWIECTEDGTWGPSPLPQCVARSAKPCRLPSITNSNLARTGRTWAVGDWVSVKCADNYMLNRYDLRALECLGSAGPNDYGWDRDIPTCEVIRCPHIRMWSPGSLTYSQESSTLFRGVGSTVTASCNEGFTLKGPRVRWCTDAGSWNSTLQICDDGATLCGNPGVPIHGKKLGDRYNEGDVVKFKCDRGYTLIGAESRTCLAKGSWTGEETRCMGPHEYMSVEEVSKRLGDGIGRLSMETGDSELFKLKMESYMTKNLLYGKHDMSVINPDMRASLGDLKGDGGLDVYFVLDTSGSISRKEREKSVEIVKGLVNKLGVSTGANKKGGTGIGIVAFNSTAWKTRLVSELDSKEKVFQVLEDIASEATGGGTAPSRAFEALQTQLIPDARINNKKDTIAIILLTDGLVNEGGSPVNIIQSITQENKRYKQELHIYCLGVGNADISTLKDIASNGTEYLMKVKGYEVFNIVSMLISNHTDFSRCGLAGPRNSDTSHWAEANVWRWMGALYKYPLDDRSDPLDQMGRHRNTFHCGASLLKPTPDSKSSKWVLTAAHCVQRGEAWKYLVKFGSLTSSKNLTDKPTVVRVSRIIMHPGYVARTMTNDTALLRLEDEIPFSLDIRPVCLPAQGSENLYNDDQKAVVLGWGYWNSSNQVPSATLKQLDVEIKSGETCANTTAGLKSKYVYGLNFCAGGVNSANGEILDACKKDSGGPLLVSQVDRDGLTSWTQAGIVSFGDGCGQRGKYGVYSKVSSYVDWIKSEIRHG